MNITIITILTSILVSAVTAYITSILKTKEEAKKWYGEFKLKYAESIAKEPELANSLATQFAIGYLIIPRSKTKRDKIFIPPGSRFIIGRDERCDIILKKNTISRRHCLILSNESSVSILDLTHHSTVYVNKKVVSSETPMKLKNKDTIDISDFKIRFYEI